MLNSRVFLSKNGLLSDLSLSLNNFKSGIEALSIVASEDTLFFSSPLPFNHLYFLVSTPSVLSSSITLEAWNNKEWRPLVDVNDGTRTSAITFQKSGRVSFALAKNEQWVIQDTERMTNSGIETLKVYDHYWLRLRFTADTSFSLKFVGQKFSEDEDLGALFPDLNTEFAKTQFNNGLAGKTNWDDQHFEAAEFIVRELENTYNLNNRSQVIRWDRLRHASVYKVAEIIFNSHGNDGRENREDAKKEYKQALQFANQQFDRNRNTRLDENEISTNTTIIRR